MKEPKYKIGDPMYQISLHDYGKLPKTCEVQKSRINVICRRFDVIYYANNFHPDPYDNSKEGTIFNPHKEEDLHNTAEKAILKAQELWGTDLKFEFTERND